MNGSATRQTVLCRLDELEVPDAKGFILGKGAGRRNVFVVRNASGIYAYENACPHSRGPLEWVPDQFLSIDRTHIQCTLHGSLFRTACRQDVGISYTDPVYEPTVGQILIELPGRQ